ncbi:MAG: cysteine desulfurase, partial [Anaerolineae bacterium]|nr:cysteine desulfurase [Anaerolineae bacterium]
MPTRSIYLDHSASTPTDPRVVEVMIPYFTEIYGNASSMHQFGRRAERAIEDSRETVAQILNCKPSEIVFTSGGSESDNLAIRGAAWAMRQQQGKRHLLTTPTEHEAVGRTIRQLGDVMGFRSTILPVDPQGTCHPADFEQAIEEDTGFASVMYANNEVGTIQPVAALGSLARERGILFHTDAVQAGGQLMLDVQQLNVDMLSLSAHKFYGPKGVGVLYIREGVALESSQTGGSHENGRRAGTHNTPFIVGLAKALEIAYAEREKHNAHYQAMRDRLIEGVLADVPSARLTGHPDQRLPAHASFLIEGIDSNTLLMHLDMNGIAASSGSACKT